MALSQSHDTTWFSEDECGNLSESWTKDDCSRTYDRRPPPGVSKWGKMTPVISQVTGETVSLSYLQVAVTRFKTAS